MENAYYVTHPRIDKTAVVFAPATEKARTTFLDWLERHNLIRRADRQAFRRDMIAERLEDPSVPADTVLHYGYEDYVTSRIEDRGPDRSSREFYRTEEERRLEAGASPEEVYYPKPTEEEERLIVGEESKEVYYPGKVEGEFRGIPEGEESDIPLGEWQEEESKPGPEKKMMPVQQVMLRGYMK